MQMGVDVSFPPGRLDKATNLQIQALTFVKARAAMCVNGAHRVSNRGIKTRNAPKNTCAIVVLSVPIPTTGSQSQVGGA